MNHYFVRIAKVKRGWSWSVTKDTGSWRCRLQFGVRRDRLYAYRDAYFHLERYLRWEKAVREGRPGEPIWLEP